MDFGLLIRTKYETMTQTLATTTTKAFKITNLGLNTTTTKRPVGVISYVTTTGRIAQCEVFTPFWVGLTPRVDEISIYLINKGHGQIRFNTVKYASLV